MNPMPPAALSSERPRSATRTSFLAAAAGLAAAFAAPAQEPVVSLRNEAAALTVASWRTAARYGKVEAPAGKAFVVVATEWRNLIPKAVVAGAALPTPYLVPDLAAQLFLVTGGGRIAPFAASANGRPGVLSAKRFVVPDPELPTRGNLVFEVDAGTSGPFVLAFVDERHGPMAATLAAEPLPAAAPAVAGPVRNALLEAHVAGVRVLEDEGAPPGTETVAIDLRLRSVHQPDPQAKCAQLVRWPGWQDHVQLLVDGTQASRPVHGPFDETAVVLPVVATGGEITFRVPKVRRSVTLGLWFPEVDTPRGRTRPQPIVLPLGGSSEPAAERPALASWQDPWFAVRITGCRVAADTAVLEFDVQNHGRTPEWLQPFAQFALADRGGQKVGAAEQASEHVPLPPPATLLVPPSERRTFALAFPGGAGAARLSFASADPAGSRVVDLPGQPGEGTPAAAGASSPPATAAPATAPETAPSAPEPSVASAAAAPPPSAPPSAATPAAVPRVAKGLAGVGLTPAQVNAAIDRGSAALWALLQNDVAKGVPFGARGEHLLASLALLHARAHERVPEFATALHAYLDAVDVTTLTVYQLGLLCMTIEALGDARHVPLLRRATRALIDGQGPQGTWAYASGATRESLRDPDAADATAVLRVLVTGAPADASAPPRPGRQLGGDGDNSVSQFALLGLRAALRCGVPVPATTWTAALATTAARQEADGGWNYQATGKSYASMTCAGICSSVLCRHALGEAEPTSGPAIQRGLAWLAANVDVTQNVGNHDWDYYSLYSLERVGRVVDVEFFGEHEWYPEGARHLLARQRADGTWISTRNGTYEAQTPHLATSFALLFLTRATHGLREPERTGPGRLETAVALPPSPRVYVILDASGSMLEAIDGVPKFEVARDAVGGLVAALPDGAELALRVYGHRKRAIDPGADDDTALEVPMQRLQREALQKKLASLRARGKTPLARSLQQALRELPAGSEGREVTLVLLTDGGDDTAARSQLPQVADELAKRNGLRVCVVGFDIRRPDQTAQLQEFAARALGRYLPAPKAQDLAAELQSAVLGAPREFTVTDAEGRTAGGGAFGTPLTLPPGRYQLAARAAGETFTCGFTIGAGATTSVVFDVANLPRARR